ncbi:MAG: DUF1932 domain-containing protein [Actinobacteria bacterium]|nr:DUF1932 domain-containing protein [Actinomycetota bacterium]
MTQRIGILHPGNMGISVAASAQNGGNRVYWASDGRSPRTRERAEKFNLVDAYTMADLCETCEVIISLCPPHAAEEVAEQVLARGYEGLYLDANAISPQRSTRIGQRLCGAGVRFVDGGIIGGPAWKPGETCLYLSGSEAERVAGLFSAGPLQARVIGESIGKASALKMCYSANSKGSAALLCGVLAVAEALGVKPELEAQWSREGSDFARVATDRVRGVAGRAWRFVGEMEEIASTFREAGLPGEFHDAAAALYGRLAGFKDVQQAPTIEEVLAALSRR